MPKSNRTAPRPREVCAKRRSSQVLSHPCACSAERSTPYTSGIPGAMRAGGGTHETQKRGRVRSETREEIASHPAANGPLPVIASTFHSIAPQNDAEGRDARAGHPYRRHGRNEGNDRRFCATILWTSSKRLLRSPDRRWSDDPIRSSTHSHRESPARLADVQTAGGRANQTDHAG